MTIQTTRNLYQAHANVLSSLGYVSPVDIAQQSFSTFRQACREQLNFSETRTLYRAAQQHVQHLQAYRRKIVSHANPQLKNALYLQADPMSVESRDYEAQFDQRADVYVPRDSVASMFSPAAYLTELYREGRQLHQVDKLQHLDNRRPDLQSLSLSQSNLDTPISTLALSNDILRRSLDQTDLDQQLARRLYPFDLPYHAPFSGIEAALTAQHSSVDAIAAQLAATKLSGSVSNDTCRAFTNQLSPALVEALLEPIASDDDSLSTQLQHHFGSGITAAALADADTFCVHTGISRDALNAYLSLPGLTQSLNSFTAGYTTEAIAIAPDDAGAQYLNAGNEDNATNFVTIAGNTLVVDSSTLSQTADAPSDCYVLPCTDPDRLRFRYKFTQSSGATGADELTITVNGVTAETRMVNNSYAHWLEFSLVLQGAMSGTIGIDHDSELSTLSYQKSNDSITTAYLIRLSQLIRYAQATGLSPATLDRLITLSQGSDATPTINDQTPLLTAQAVNYSACYGINEDDAVVLAGGEINIYAPEGQLSQFDRLFNKPPLHGEAFTTDDADDTISFAPDDTVYAAQRAVLKRALGVDDAGLSVLATLCDDDNQSWARSLARISDLYRVALWAKVHDLSPTALQCVLELNGKTNDLYQQPTTLLTEYLQAVYATDQWLQAQSLSVNTLHAMMTKNYPTTLTPEMDSLLRALYQSADDEARLKETFAPHLAAALGLSGLDQALLLEDWIEDIAAEQGLVLTSMAAFWREIIKLYDDDDTTVASTTKLASFCQALGQLTLITKTWQLSTTELALLVHKPQMLQGSQDKLSLTLSNLQSLTRFKTLQQAVGERASELLTALDKDALSIDLLAQLLEQPVAELTLATTAMSTSPSSFNITQASHIDLWLQTAQGLGVSVSVVDMLLTQALDASYASWQTLAGNIQASLPEQPALTVNRRLDEALGTALCAYYFTSNQARQVIAGNIPLQSRDDLFQYLLIDNQISAEIDTSRLAEAISSVQLYIHRCLQGLEANVDRNQQLEAFFVEWDQYNKRYSTWAGVSQLVYYPENYIDPTLRYNQTGLQQQLLNEVSQSQLSSDSVETAYLNYLNGFEDIANLKVLCGYHHAAEMDKGISYFVGRTNAEPYRYFWRSLNHEASDGLGGYVASAWTDWEEISTPIKPVRDQVRPVIFNNRLYIGWVELRSRPQTNDDGEVVDTIDEYLLQLSYRKINNSWNPAMSFALTIPDTLIPTSGPIFDVYLSYHPLQNALLAMLYDPTVEEHGLAYDAIVNLGAWTGGFINNRMQYNPIVDGQDADSNPDNEAVAVFSLFYKNLNGPSTPNKVIRHINAASFSTTTTPGTATNTTDASWLTVSHVDIVNEEVDNLSVPPVLSYTAQATIETKDISVQPTVINTPSTTSDNSGSGFDVSTHNVTSVINSGVCIHTANLTIVTANNDYSFGSGNTTSSYISGDTGYGGYIKACSSHLHISNNQPAVSITFYWANPYSLCDRLLITNAESQNKVFECGWLDNQDTRINFTEVNPSENHEGCLVYEVSSYIDNNDPDYYQVNAYRLTVVSNITAVSKSLTVNFAGENRTIPASPATTHIVENLSFSQSTSPNGSSNIYYLQTVDGSGTVWQRSYTLGYSPYTPARAFTYNWGEGEVPLSANDTTLAANEYVSAIPSNGLSQTRTLTVKQDGAEVFKQDFSIVTTQNEALQSNPADYFQIAEDNKQQALYLEASNHTRRTRLNTLFADELIQRANSGLDNVLNWGSQQLPEPKLGNGGYVDLVFNLYDATTHGDKKWYKVYLYKAEGNNKDVFIAEGNLSVDVEITQRVYLPYTGRGTWPLILHIRLEFSKGMLTEGETQRFNYDITTDTFTIRSDNDGRTPGLKTSSVVSATTEPMDFSGANGLYFWELFYYTPMLVTEKLLQGQNFEEAENWLQYVFSPQGYVEGSYPSVHHVDRQWNVRPLAEDTAWDDTPTDSTDPDVVAQGDPMHYKVATYMKLLDLLIARGDMAYRLLERDTLTEAKMWYVTALNLLGTEPDLPSTSHWPNPTLSMAASTTLQTQSLQLLEQLSDGGAPVVQADELQIRTANSLTALFLPSENDKLKGYWQTLHQRLFNLRHNLSLDGQPLTLPLFANPADPKALQSAASAASAAGSTPLPTVGLSIAIQRFPVMLESARNLLAQLVQYGSTLSSVLERKDAEALNTLMQTQAQDLMQRNIQSQDKIIEQLQAEQQTLEVSLAASTARRDSYKTLLDEGVSRTEQQAIDERIAAGSMSTAANAMRIAGAALNLAPNTFGLAVGGSKWGAVLEATAFGMDVSASGLSTSADSHTTSEQYRRRAQEWTIQFEAVEHEIKQNEAQQTSLEIQLEAARLQKESLEVQREQGQAQLEFLKTKFSNQALYSWMQGKLSALFYQFYDLAVARCLKAQLGYQWETKDKATFVQPGAWEDNHAGLLCGEALMLNLAQMETTYQDWDSSALEVSRTVSMAQEMENDLVGSSFNAEVNEVLTNNTPFGSTHQLSIATDNTSLVATIDLSALKITDDYPDSVVGADKIRRIKQVSVSLPALLGPYQDIQALLAYSGSGGDIHQSCTSATISHGINDSGQFQLNFNDDKYLPFEGLPIDGGGSAGLTLTFPNAIGTGTEKQNVVLQTLSDIILHLNYTIR